MSLQMGFSNIAFLLADHARAAMLTALMDGSALPAGELAYIAGITAQTASAHLSKLLEGELITVENQGRHRYYRLANANVAQALELLSAIQPQATIRRRMLTPKAEGLQFCRSCYDHLAGEVGVALAQALLAKGYLLAENNKTYQITSLGHEWLQNIGIDMLDTSLKNKSLAKSCLDWTERTYHIAGLLGTRLLHTFIQLGWLQKVEGSRAIILTPKGWQALQKQLDLHQFIKNPT